MLKSETEYRLAIALVESLMDAEDGSRRASLLDVLVGWVDDYEKVNHADRYELNDVDEWED